MGQKILINSNCVSLSTHSRHYNSQYYFFHSLLLLASESESEGVLSTLLIQCFSRLTYSKYHNGQNNWSTGSIVCRSAKTNFYQTTDCIIRLPELRQEKGKMMFLLTLRKKVLK